MNLMEKGVVTDSYSESYDPGPMSDPHTLTTDTLYTSTADADGSNSSMSELLPNHALHTYGDNKPIEGFDRNDNISSPSFDKDIEDESTYRNEIDGVLSSEFAYINDALCGGSTEAENHCLDDAYDNRSPELNEATSNDLYAWNEEDVTNILEDPSYIDTVSSDNSTTALLKDELEQHISEYKNNEDNNNLENERRNITSSGHLIANMSDNLPFSVPGKESVFGKDNIDFVSIQVHEVDQHSNVNDEKDFSHIVSSGDIKYLNNTMRGLVESPAYIDEMHCSTNDLRLIARACRNAVLNMSQDIIPVDPTDDQSKPPEENDAEERQNHTEINSHTKNLIILGLSLLFVTIINSLRNLQSSLNAEGGLGLYSLGANYLGFMTFSLFTPFIVQWAKPKPCLILGMIPHLLYVLANISPSFAVFIPASFFLGVGSALLWNALSTYITHLARSYALQNDKRTVHVASKYFGIVFFFYQIAIVGGNLISSLVLMGGRQSTQTDNNDIVVAGSISLLDQVGVSVKNDSYSEGSFYSNDTSEIKVYTSRCGSRYCHQSVSSNISTVTAIVDEDTKYLLLGINGVCTVFGIVIAGLLLDSLKPYRTARVSCGLVCHQLLSVFSCIVDKRFLMLFTLFFFSNMQNAFLSGEITKAFVTCPFGIYMVGYTMICFGVCAGVTSYLSGQLNSRIGHRNLITLGVCSHGILFLTVVAGLINLLLLGVMAVWRIQPNDMVYVFILIGGWGLADGIWFSQTSSLISEVFPDCPEAAFAGQRFVQGLGGALCFSYATYFCMTVKMFILGLVCIVGLVTYIIQVFLPTPVDKYPQEAKE